MQNYYQKVTTLYSRESYRVAGCILFYLLGYNVCKNAGTANILTSPSYVDQPYEILIYALPRIDTSLVLSVGAVPTPIARHKNNRWSYLSRDLVTNVTNETEVQHYVNILKNTYKDNYQMASKLSGLRGSSDTIKNYIGQIVTFLSIETVEGKFGPQVKAAIMDKAGNRKKVYTTPNIGNKLQEAEDANLFPLVATVTTFETGNKKNPTGYGIEDEDISPALIKKLEEQATKLMNQEDDTEELDQSTGKWKKVKSNTKAPATKAPTQKAKASKTK